MAFSSSLYYTNQFRRSLLFVVLVTIWSGLITTTTFAWQQPKLSESSFSTSSSSSSSSRRQWFQGAITTAATIVATSTMAPKSASAAPPFSVIAEELGYFPVTNNDGQTVMVAKRIQRDSSTQAIELAKHLSSQGAVVYETYWCPHSARQRELFGKQAWAIVSHVECSPKGYQSQALVCSTKERIDGYPTWKLKNNKKQVVMLDGERSLSVIAEASGFKGKFDESLEKNVPPLLGSACKLNK